VRNCRRKFQQLIEKVNSTNKKSKSVAINLTLPPSNSPMGGIHPLTATRQRIIEILSALDSTFPKRPEIEDDWHTTVLELP
jgi:phenylalanyl-tRNA synthetase alpha chain